MIFKEAAARGTVRKYLSLFPGLGFGAGYKILQRVYKFGGQVSLVLYYTLVLVLLFVLFRFVVVFKNNFDRSPMAEHVLCIEL